MSEVKRYHVTEAGLVEGQSLGRINVVLGADFDRVEAERDALQLRLNAADQALDEADDGFSLLSLEAGRRIDLLEGLLEKMLKAMKRTYQAGRDRIVDLGGDCDGVEYMMNSDLTVQEVRTVLKPADEACQFPQSCTTRCDCDIPDFSPGNGNKARRRAEALLGFKVVEDPTLAPGEIKLVQPTVKDAEQFRTCLGCFGAGTICTGIEEASSTICNGCNGTGRENP
ncbi:hypothetical protein [Pseudomonas sp. IT-P4]|uniref:hypothetical protein n=1 Tax=Pseudomonas sp. IT-P4 TaxID=3026446 RepID=UPI0039E155D9